MSGGTDGWCWADRARPGRACGDGASRPSVWPATWRTSPAASVEAVVIGAEGDDLAAARRRARGETWAVSHPPWPTTHLRRWGDALSQVAKAAGASARQLRSAPTAATRCWPTWPPSRTCRCRANVRPAVTVTGRSVGVDLTRWGGACSSGRPSRPGSARHGGAHASPRWNPTRPRLRRRRRAVHPGPRRGRRPDPHRRARPPEAGSSLVGAAVVVSGGRGVGSAEGFAVLRSLASLLGGAVGCSRVVTNQRLASPLRPGRPDRQAHRSELYIACGISGAIQHWVG